MLELVKSIPLKEPNKCFKVFYVSGEWEFITATSMGVTEDLKEFITFYNEVCYDTEDLVCMITKSLISKITAVEIPA